MNTLLAYEQRSEGVSVALCTYQGRAYLAKQLLSLQQQTLKPSELVICDDQSSDTTADIVADFTGRASFPVHFQVNPERLGVTANYQQAFSLCRHRLIAPCDQDDIWEPTKLARLVASFEKDASCMAVFCNASIMTEKGELTSKKQWRELGFSTKRVAAWNRNEPRDGAFAQLLRYNVVSGMAMMFRSELLDLALPMPESFIHDEWLSLIASAVGKMQAIDEPLVRYRRHGNQRIGVATGRLWTQWRYARRHMGDEYLERQLRRTQSLYDKLISLKAGGVPPHGLESVKEKINFLNRRLALRQSVLGRVFGATNLWLQGRYSRFGHGWRSYAQDLFI